MPAQVYTCAVLVNEFISLGMQHIRLASIPSTTFLCSVYVTSEKMTCCMYLDIVRMMYSSHALAYFWMCTTEFSETWDIERQPWL